MRDLVTHFLRRTLSGLRLEPAPDPFRTLELQQRLSRLSAELVMLQDESGQVYAAGHHLRAALLAYDQTLREACLLVGVPVGESTGPADRLMAEAGLAQAGWTW